MRARIEYVAVEAEMLPTLNLRKQFYDDGSIMIKDVHQALDILLYNLK